MENIEQLKNAIYLILWDNGSYSFLHLEINLKDTVEISVMLPPPRTGVYCPPFDSWVLPFRHMLPPQADGIRHYTANVSLTKQPRYRMALCFNPCIQNPQSPTHQEKSHPRRLNFRLRKRRGESYGYYGG